MPEQSEERRRFRRVAFAGPAVLELGQAQLVVRLLDVSLRGALAAPEPGAAVAVGDVGVLALDLGGGAQVRMEGAVVHAEAGRVGFACRRIDIESISHLRRLVELNLGEPALLERDLEQLG